MSPDQSAPYRSGWIKPKHDCMDTLNRDPRRKDDHAGSVWRCECGKAWRVHGFLTWRLRRFDAARGSDRDDERLAAEFFASPAGRTASEDRAAGAGPWADRGGAS